jgi:predicted DNA-binding transcriptional regulator AlpA
MPGFLFIPAFCAEYAVHRSTLYRVLAAGTGPRITKIGRRTLISRAAAEEWRATIDGGQVETERMPTLTEAQRGRR